MVFRGFGCAAGGQGLSGGPGGLESQKARLSKSMAFWADHEKCMAATLVAPCARKPSTSQWLRCMRGFENWSIGLRSMPNTSL